MAHILVQHRWKNEFCCQISEIYFHIYQKNIYFYRGKFLFFYSSKNLFLKAKSIFSKFIFQISKFIFLYQNFYFTQKRVYMSILWFYMRITRKIIDEMSIIHLMIVPCDDCHSFHLLWLHRHSFVLMCVFDDFELPVQTMNVFHVNCDYIARVNIGPFKLTTTAMHWLPRD